MITSEKAGKDLNSMDLKKPPIIAHIKNTALKENPNENNPDFSGTMERDMLIKITVK